MTIESHGFVPSIGAEDARTSVEKFVQKLPLLLKHSDTIMNCADYFFCELPFASCSWPYLSGDGLLYLGYLLIGWKSGAYMGECPHCSAKVHVFSFGGSPLSGTNKWTGVCVVCVSVVKSSWEAFTPRATFTINLRQQYPSTISVWQETDGVEFSWGGSGLRPAQKNRLVNHAVANPLTLDQLIEELVDGSVRKMNPPSVSLLEVKTTIKFGKKRLR